MAAEKLTSTEQMLDDLRELAHVFRTLKAVGGEGGAAQIMRNEVITRLFNHGVSVSRIAYTAGVDRGWPYTVAEAHPGKRAKFQDAHPDLVGLLLEARKSVDLLLHLAEEGILTVEETPDRYEQVEGSDE